MAGPLILRLRSQLLRPDPEGYAAWVVQQRTEEWPVERTALLLCDVWDRHWCRGACERLEGMIPRMRSVVEAARTRGVQIVHAPSDTMAFYAGSPARRRILEQAPVEPPAELPHDDPPLPVDASDQGADTGEGSWHVAWTRQHTGIHIDEERDAISDNGREVYAFLSGRGIDRLLLMGVHANMCVLNRSFAIKQMVRWGMRVALIGDLTDAMYNPARPPYVSHREGTRLVVEYIEKFWCPTVESGQFLED